MNLKLPVCLVVIQFKIKRTNKPRDKIQMGSVKIVIFKNIMQARLSASQVTNVNKLTFRQFKTRKGLKKPLVIHNMYDGLKLTRCLKIFMNKNNIKHVV